MDARLSTEQRELREAAAKLADDLGPKSVLDLDDAARVARLEKAVAATGWRGLRSDGASGVEVAIVAESGTPMSQYLIEKAKEFSRA